MAKTNMVFEAANQSRQWFFTQEDRESLLTAFRPPLESIVWIGRYSGYSGGFGEGRRLRDAITDPPHLVSPLSEGYVNTFAFGHFLLHSIAVRRKANMGGRTTIHTRNGQWSRLLQQVWPIKHQRITWPPALSFSDGGTTIEELGERFTVPKMK